MNKVVVTGVTGQDGSFLVDFLLENLSKKIAPQDREVLEEIHYKGKSYRDLAKERGYSHAWWQKYHTQLLNKLKSLQDPN